MQERYKSVSVRGGMTPDSRGHWRNRVIGISLTERSDVYIYIYICRSRPLYENQFDLGYVVRRWALNVI